MKIWNTLGEITDWFNRHKPTHEDGGVDEISVAGLSGLLADDQHVLDAEVTAVAIAKTTVDAQSILGGISDDTPVSIAVAEQRLVGRITSGNVTALTGTQVMALLSGQAGATFDWNNQELTNLGNVKLYSGGDLTLYSDAGSTVKAHIDGATGHIGVGGTSAVASSAINYWEIYAFTVGNEARYGTTLAIEAYNATTTHTNLIMAGNFEAIISDSNSQNWTNTVGVQGVYGRITMGSAPASAATITGAASFYADASVAGGASDTILTNYYGLYVEPRTLVGNSRLTNDYGIYVGAQAGGATLNYAIYTAGGAVYHAGAVTLGGALNITGTTTIDTALTGIIRADSGVLSVDSTALLIANLENPPTEDETDKAATSEWSFDHDANTTTAHGAVSAATASKHVVRDASARAKFAAPSAAGDVLIKGTRVTVAELPAMTDEKIWKGTGASVEEVDMPTGGYTEGARVYHDANQSIANDTLTTLAFNQERYDTDTIHDNATNNSRLTCRTAGKYAITFNGLFAANATGPRYALFQVNGTVIALTYVAPNPNASYATGIQLTTQYNLSVDDYVTVSVWQLSTGALNIVSLANYSPEFMMQRIG